MLDVCDPSEEFTVARFQRLVNEALSGIESRANRALVVGGTGLYHRAVVDALDLPGRYARIRAELEEQAKDEEGVRRLYARLETLDLEAARRMAPTNARRIVRALEVAIGSGKPFSSFGPGLSHYGPSRFATFGLALGRAELDRRIARRLDRQLADGFLEEVSRLSKRPEGLSRTARQALGYKELLAHLEGTTTIEEARAQILRRTKTFARRQESWFRRDPRIVWIDAAAPDLVARFVALADTTLGRSTPTPARD